MSRRPARPEPRRCSRSRARSTSRRRSTSACAITPGSSPMRRRTSRASRSRCWWRTAASARRRRRPIARQVLDYYLIGKTEAGRRRVPAPARRRGRERLRHGRASCAPGLGGAHPPHGRFPARGARSRIVGVGLVTLFSAADQNLARVASQAGSLGFALVLMWIVANVPPQTLARVAVPLYVAGGAAARRGGALRHRRERLAALAESRRSRASSRRSS